MVRRAIRMIVQETEDHRHEIRSIGIDLGKTTFHLVALGDRGKILLKKKVSRKQLLALAANLPASLIGLEACSGSHFLARALREQGHDARLVTQWHGGGQAGALAGNGLGAPQPLS